MARVVSPVSPVQQESDREGRPGLPRRRRPGAYPAVVACVLAVSLLSLSLTLCATWDNSPTVDEFAHLPAGVYYWRTGDLTLYDLNPPPVSYTHLRAHET